MDKLMSHPLIHELGLCAGIKKGKTDVQPSRVGVIFVCSSIQNRGRAGVAPQLERAQAGRECEWVQGLFL